jgi:hypothetical protein
MKRILFSVLVFSSGLFGQSSGVGNFSINGQGCTLSIAACTVVLSAVNPQTSTYAVTTSDFSNYKLIAVASGTFTITLTASGSQPPAGQYVTIVNYGSGVVTVSRNGQNLNGGTGSFTLNAGSAAAPSTTEVWSDGTNYEGWVLNPTSGGTVTGVSWTGGIVSIANTTSTPAFTIAGTSGGVPYFASASTWASSGVLGTGQFLLGGGAGSPPTSSNITGDCTNSSAVLTCTQLNGSNFTVNTSGVPTKVSGVPSTGKGVPVIMAASNVTSQSTSQTSVTLASSPAAGFYHLQYYANQNAVCTTGSNTVTFTWNWTDSGNARSLTTGFLPLAATQSATLGYLSGGFDFWITSGNVTYTSSVPTTCATGTSTYDVHATLAVYQ